MDKMHTSATSGHADDTLATPKPRSKDGVSVGIPSLNGIAQRLNSPTISSNLSAMTTLDNVKTHEEKAEAVLPIPEDPAHAAAQLNEAESMMNSVDIEPPPTPVIPDGANSALDADPFANPDNKRFVEHRQVSFDEYMCFQELSFEWADSYDTKDFDRLAAILAPEMNIDYSIVNPELPKDDKMSAQSFLAFVSSPVFLGNPLIRTQHLLGASKYVKLGENTALGRIQIRAAHQREDSNGKACHNGHGHALLHHLYQSINGRWLLAGVKPVVYWNEGPFEKIFQATS